MNLIPGKLYELHEYFFIAPQHKFIETKRQFIGAPMSAGLNCIAMYICPMTSEYKLEYQEDYGERGNFSFVLIRGIVYIVATHGIVKMISKK